MELIYLWIKKYKNIDETGFNFSSQYTCKYDPLSNDLTIEENEDFIPNFFGNNINLTAIVGRNGSGKSAILEFIQKILIYDSSTGGEEPESFYILVMQLAGEKIIITNTDHEKFPSKYKTLLKERGEVVNRICPLFLDSELPYNRFNEYGFVGNGFAVIPNFERIKEDVYVDLEFSIICKKLLIMMEKGVQNFPFYNFEPVRFTFDPDRSNLEKNKNQLVYEYHKKGLFDDVLIEKVDLTVDGIYDAFDFFVFELFIEQRYDKEDFLKRLTKIQDGHEFGVLGVVADTFDEKIQEDLFLLRKYIYSEPELLISENNIDNSVMEVLKKYIEYFEINLIDAENRSYQDLSHGERKVFGLDVSIFYRISYYADLCTYFFLGFDEPELGLHPEWQRKYINYTVQLLKKLNKEFHLFVTSHSPFILSDIPKSNIIFLDSYIKDDSLLKNKPQKIGNCKVVGGTKKQTFGANIHTLLSDSFFMKDGLIGEFAKEKIEKVISFLRSENTKLTLEEAEKIIQIVGEPILKVRLERMLLEYKDKNRITSKSDLEKEILELQARLNKVNENQIEEND